MRLGEENPVHGFVDSWDVGHKLVADGGGLEVRDQIDGLVVVVITDGVQHAVPERPSMLEGVVRIHLVDCFNAIIDGVR